MGQRLDTKFLQHHPNRQLFDSVELDLFGIATCRVSEFRRSGSSQWINGYVDDRSGIGEVDDNNTGEVEERVLVQVFSVMCGGG